MTKFDECRILLLSIIYKQCSHFISNFIKALFLRRKKKTISCHNFNVLCFPILSNIEEIKHLHLWLNLSHLFILFCFNIFWFVTGEFISSLTKMWINIRWWLGVRHVSSQKHHYHKPKAPYQYNPIKFQIKIRPICKILCCMQIFLQGNIN